MLPALAALALPLAPRPLHAQLSLAVGGGAARPAGALASRTDAGYHVLVGARVGVPAIPVSLRLDGMATEFRAQPPARGRVPLYAVTGNLALSLPLGALSPYVIGGVGYYNGDPAALVSGRGNDRGYNAGVGVRFNLAVVHGFAEVRYHLVRTTATDGTRGTLRFIPITLGVSF
jgi:hypothetical protein